MFGLYTQTLYIVHVHVVCVLLCRHVPVAIFLITIVMEEGQAEFKETVLTLTKTK